MSQLAHPVPFSTGGTVARPRGSRYDNDSRVVANDGGYIVFAPDRTYIVQPDQTGGWEIRTAKEFDLVPTAGGGYATGIRSADDAIGALIGDAHA